jgi:peptidoglycan hydrolase-like protein with peptidoglycan-binding domain
MCCAGMVYGAALAFDAARVDEPASAIDRVLGGEQPPSITAEDERDITQQLEKLRANPKERRRVIVVAQMLLGRLGYGIGPFDGRFDDKTRRATKYYQEVNKLSATGELDYRTLKKLMDDSTMIEQLPVQLPPATFTGDKWDTAASAGGTWISVQGGPSTLQITAVECDRKGQYCIESTATVEEGNQMILQMYRYEIERWDDREIVTKPKIDHCTAGTLRLNRSQKTVTRVVSAALLKQCSHTDSKEGTWRLEDGVKVWTELSRARRETFKRVVKTGDFSFEDIQQ